MLQNNTKHIQGCSKTFCFQILETNMDHICLGGSHVSADQVMDVRPDFTCGFDIWDQMNRTLVQKIYEKLAGHLWFLHIFHTLYLCDNLM